MSTCRIVGALSFDILEAELLRELPGHEGVRERRVWVLAPTNLLALHLMRTAGRVSGTFGVEFLTLRGAARAMGAASFAREARTAMPDGAAELVVERALDGLPDDAYLAALRGFPGSARAILRAVDLLRNGLWTPQALVQAAGAMERSASPDAGRRLTEVAGVWRELEEFKRSAHFFDAEDMLLRASDGAPDSMPNVVFLYGFYDLTPLQRRLAGAVLAEAEAATAFLLWDEAKSGPAPGFEYAARTVDWLKARLKVEAVDCLKQGTPRTDLARLRGGLAGRAARPARAFDGSVHVVSCAGEAAEAEEVARRLLRVYGAGDSGPPPTAGVLARTSTDVAQPLTESLDRSGLPWYTNAWTPLSQTMPGRILLALLDLAVSDAERTAVVSLLSMTPQDWGEDLNPTVFDRLSRKAGIVRGWDNWAKGFSDLAASLDDGAARSDHEGESAALAREAEQCRASREKVAGLLGQVRGLTSAGRWRGVAEKLGALLADHTRGDEPGYAEVLAAVGGLGALDVTGVPPRLGRAAGLARRMLAGASLARGSFQRAPVTVCDIMTSRGVTHDVVFLPRLLEKVFPRKIATDPILSEGDRALLSRRAEALGCGELPLPSLRPQEERYLLRLALGSARRAVVLLYPRLEQDSGRPLVCSRFIARVCEVLCGGPVEAEKIENAAVGDLVERIRLTPAGRADDAVDGGEYDLAVHTSAAGESAAAGYTGALSEHFRRAVEMENSRWRRGEFGPYDGAIRASDLRSALEAKHVRFGVPISASRLEMYATCPFSYFMHYVLEVEEPEKPQDDLELPPDQWGRLMHDVLRRAYEGGAKGRRLGELGEADVEKMMARAGEAADTVGRTYAAARPAIWAAQREKALEQVRRLIETERSGNGDALPSEFELAFGMGAEQCPLRVETASGTAVSIRGRIDRLDRLDDGGVQVIDYKTGSSSGKKKNSLAGGRQLQLPLYLLAAAGMRGVRKGRARYLFVRDRKFQDQFTLAEPAEWEDQLKGIIQLIVKGVGSGEFFPAPLPAPDRFCDEYCAFRNACGAARRMLAEAKGGSAGTISLRALRDLDGAPA